MCGIEIKFKDNEKLDEKFEKTHSKLHEAKANELPLPSFTFSNVQLSLWCDAVKKH